MQEIELTGDYYEMGQQYGRILEQVGFSPEPASPEKRQFVHNCEPAVQEHAPELLDELQGIADIGNWDLELIQAMPLALGYEAGCSVVAVSGEHTVDGKPLFGRNNGFFKSFGDFSELYRTHPANRLASIGCSEHWAGRHDGINEAGLAIGHTFVPHYEHQPGIMFALAARAVLDTCQTVSEAVEFLEQIPHARNTNFLVADATGDIAIVEASHQEVTVTHPTNGFGAITNHFQSGVMAAFEAPDEAERSESEMRFQNLTDWFETRSNRFNIEDIQRILGDPANGVCVCGDESEDDPVTTLWSWTARLGESVAHLSKGSPDETPYESVAI